jgi:hypothetical protein
MRKYLVKIFILTLITVPFLSPFLKPGYFDTDDGLWAVVRQSSMHRELRAGQFPVRWSGDLNYGYGYPLFQFSYPGPYYIGEIFRVLGYNFIDSVKAVFVISTVISVIGMYFFIRELWQDDIAGWVAAFFYLGSQYRIINLYIRGSIGETVAFAIFPFLCLFGLKLLQTGKRRYLFVGSILLALLIISHNVMALIFIPFFIYFLIVEIFLRYVKLTRLISEYIDKINQKVNIKNDIYKNIFFRHLHLIIVMVLVGIGLSCFFWLPAITEMQYVKLGETPLTTIEKELKYQNLFDIEVFTKVEEMTTLGRQSIRFSRIYKYVLIALTVLMIIFLRKTKLGVALHRTILYLVPYIICLFLLTPLSLILWKIVPGLKQIDFPWRLYGLMMFIFPVIISALSQIKSFKYLGLLFAVGSLVIILPISSPLKTNNYPETFYSTNQGTTTSAAEYVSRWMKTPVLSSSQSPLIPINPQYQNITITESHNASTNKKYKYSTEVETPVLTSTMYFPGWQASLDGKEHQLQFKETNGIISTVLPAGTHILELKFNKTPIREASEIISISTLVMLISLLLIRKIKRKELAV